MAIDDPYFFDAGLAQAAVDFYPRHLCFVDGEWAGKPFILADWQAHHTRQIFGWRRRDNGYRRYRAVRGWVPRKNGKTEWMAGLGLQLMLGDGEYGAQIYSHALDKKQAAIVFTKAARMVNFSAYLQEAAQAFSTGIMCAELESTFQPLSGEALSKHGLSPHANIGDEVHAWRNGNLHTFLIQGMGARRQPLDVTISSAGEIKTYGHELYEASKRILEDPSLDPQTYVFIYEAPNGEVDWTDPAVWAAANPNLGVSLKLEFLQSECKRALQSPRLENDFKRYHLGIWVEQSRRWFPMRKWGDNTRDPNDPELWKKLAAEMKGRKGYLGIDLGSTEDLTVKLWVFPPEEKGGRITLVPTFWIPEETVEQRDSIRSPYKKWVADEAIIETEGGVTDYDFLETEVLADCRLYQIASENGIGIDAWNATQVSVHLMNEGLPVTLMRQGYGSMSAPSKELERLFISGQLEHGNHPVLKWMFGNATYRKDPAGNIKPDKERAADKIDGVVAAVMGIGLMNAAANESIYSGDRGLLVLGS